MCSGVIAITITMTAWDTTRATKASRASGCAHAIDTARRNGTVSFRTSAWVRTPPATTSGSGRMKSQTAAAEMANSTNPIANPPLFSSKPSSTAMSPTTPTSSGNETAPNVAAKMTELMSRLRLASAARSAAA